MNRQAKSFSLLALVVVNLLQVAVAPDADRVRRSVPPPDAPAVRRLPHARRPHRSVPIMRFFLARSSRRTSVPLDVERGGGVEARNPASRLPRDLTLLLFHLHLGLEHLLADVHPSRSHHMLLQLIVQPLPLVLQVPDSLLCLLHLCLSLVLNAFELLPLCSLMVKHLRLFCLQSFQHFPSLPLLCEHPCLDRPDQLLVPLRLLLLLQQLLQLLLDQRELRLSQTSALQCLTLLIALLFSRV